MSKIKQNLGTVEKNVEELSYLQPTKSSATAELEQEQAPTAPTYAQGVPQPESDTPARTSAETGPPRARGTNIGLCTP